MCKNCAYSEFPSYLETGNPPENAKSSDANHERMKEAFQAFKISHKCEIKLREKLEERAPGLEIKRKSNSTEWTTVYSTFYVIIPAINHPIAL